MANDDGVPKGLDPAAFKMMADLMRQMNQSTEAAAKSFKGMTADAIKAANEAAKTVADLEKQKTIISDMRAEAEKRGQLHKNTYQLRQNETEQLETQAKALMAGNEAQQKLGRELMKQVRLQQENNEAAQKSANTTLSAAQTLTGISDDWQDTVLGSFFQGDFEENLERTAQALMGNFTAANLLGSSLMKMQEATLEMVISADAQFAKVNELTGTQGEYNDMIMDTMQNNTQFNVSLEEAGEAVAALYTEMSNFSNMSKEAQAEAVETTAQLAALGIDAQTTGANFEILTGALGMTASAAGDVQKDFAAMAADLGVSASKIAKDFERNADVFVAYGDEATEVFKEVAAAAKATGIEMDKLLGISTGFDTFEGAAKAAGQLNAVLGGGVLNSMDLLNASEEERIRMMIQSIELSGKSWESMSKFEKQAVANAAGISDMATASKLFGQSLSEYDAAQRKVEDNAEAQAKLEERAAAAATMFEKLTRIKEQFAVAVAPIITAVHFLLDGLLALNDMTGGLLIPTLIGLLGVYKLWSIAQKSAIAGSTMEILQSKAKTLWAGLVAKAQAMKTAANNVDTTSIFANTAAQTSNTMATMRASAAKAWNTVKTHAMTAATKISTFFNWGQAASQTAVGTTSAAATPGAFGLAAGIRAIAQAAKSGGPMLIALSGALMGIGLAIAAPLILIAVIIWSLKEVVVAMLEMTDAIGPALMGLAAFIGLVALGLPIIALSIVSFFWILALAIKPVMLLTPVLPQMIGALLGIGIALWLLGKGIKQFRDDDIPGAMIIALASLWAFGLSLIPLAAVMGPGAFLVGAAIAVLGIGLLLLGKGLQQWNNVGAEDAVLAYISLWAFGLALIPLAAVMGFGAFLVGAAVGVLGIGLLLLGKGLQEWNNVGAADAVLAYISLWAFALALIPLAKVMTVGALLVGLSVGILGFGLQMLAKGIKEFNQISLGDMIELAVGLSIFGILLLPAGKALGAGGKSLLKGALFTAPALFLLSWGLKPWTEWREGWSDLPALGWALLEWSIGIGFAGLIMSRIGPSFLFGAIIVALALWILNTPLRDFAETMGAFAEIAGTMPAIAGGLALIGLSLIPFAFGLTILGIAAMLPWFWLGMMALSSALTMFGKAMADIPTDKAVALGKMFEGLTFLSDLDGVAKIMNDLAWGIYWISDALSYMPEGDQAVKFSIAADGLANLAEASVGLSAEAVTNVQGLADAAFDYALASRIARSGQDDALVNALKELAGLAKTAQSGQSGQDIVLEIDGNEFARAVDAAIDSKHGLKF